MKALQSVLMKIMTDELVGGDFNVPLQALNNGFKLHPGYGYVLLNVENERLFNFAEASGMTIPNNMFGKLG